MMGGAPVRRGIITKLCVFAPKKPNSARRKVAKLRLMWNRKPVHATIPGEGHSLHEHAAVLIKPGYAKDLPGIGFALIRGALDFTSWERNNRNQKRSKYGVKRFKAEDDETKGKGGGGAKKEGGGAAKPTADK